MSSFHSNFGPSDGGASQQGSSSNEAIDLQKERVSRAGPRTLEELLVEFSSKPEGFRGRSQQPFEVADTAFVAKTLRAINTSFGIVGSGIEGLSTQREVVDSIISTMWNAYSLLSCVFKVAPFSTQFYSYKGRTADEFHSSRIRAHQAALDEAGLLGSRGRHSLDMNELQAAIRQEHRAYSGVRDSQGLEKYLNEHKSSLLTAINSVSELIAGEHLGHFLSTHSTAGIGSFSYIDLEMQRCTNTEQEVARLKDLLGQRKEGDSSKFGITSYLVSHSLVTAVAAYNRGVAKGHPDVAQLREALDICASDALVRKEQISEWTDNSVTQSLTTDMIFDDLVAAATLLSELNRRVWDDKVGQRITEWLGYPGGEPHGLFLMKKALVDPKFLSNYNQVIGDGRILCRTDSADNSGGFPPEWLNVTGGRCGTPGITYHYHECPWGMSIDYEIETVLD